MLAQRRAGLVLIGLIGLLLSFTGRANSSRLTVLNETLDPANTGAVRFELYLSRLGTYYAELYLENDGKPAAPVAPAGVDFSLAFMRGDEFVYERDIRARFKPGEPVTTVLLLEIPRDLPQRKALELVISLHEVDPALRQSGQSLRLQLTRKVQLLPIGR